MEGTLLNIFGLQLPLENPVLIFTLILFIILFSPIVLNKLRIPHLIGLIIAGIVIGPFGLNLMARDSSIILFGTVGLLYIMFVAGLEIDLADFRKYLKNSIIFGAYTFLIPMILGTFSGFYLLDFGMNTSILLASMFASNTLITYPIVSKLGVAKNRAVNISIGGTLITTVLALLVLAVIVKMATGEITHHFYWRLSGSILLFVLFILFGFPLIGRWFFKRVDDNISQYIFVLGMVFLGSFLAQVSGIESIVGAFMAGLALNRLIPKTSPLMNRIDFVGNALFIPFFLIGVGMLINFRAFINDWETIKVAIVMSVVATLAKFLAAWITQKSFGYSADERRLIFGLSNAQAASTLAAVLVGYNIILGQDANGEPIRLLNEAVLNGTILMILVTCTIASFVTQKGAQNIALSESSSEEEQPENDGERILIPFSNAANVNELVNLSTTVKSKNKKGKLVGLNIITTGQFNEKIEKEAHKIIESAVKAAAATDNLLHPLVRYDLNVVNGIANAVKEHKITDLIIGLHEKKGISDSFLGNLTTGILTKCNTTTLIYKPFQPLATIKRHIIVVPENAEKEFGFFFWLLRVWNIGTNTGTKLVFFASEETTAFLKQMQEQHPVDAEFNIFSDWDDFLILSRHVRKDDNLMIVMSRRTHPSFKEFMLKVPSYLNKYFGENNYILVYPMQLGVADHYAANLSNPSFMEPLLEHVERLTEFKKLISGFLKKR
ncbi:cation:proton antiporter [Gaoshiqia sediminis]|uniref:Cation:proton antiporter n=1 Tax=Gaoshiqia sediminis TaxID=2986998 RepID=A0AA41YBH6_9BACT|nr:cation:proton antiporter [Gaoshiqia sediminis]MCW0484693.1 cation:proton antiporter [Gaoshiqia sediminis]